MRTSWSALDLRTGDRDDDDGARRMVSASLIKLPIMLAVLEQVDGERFGLESSLPIAPRSRVGGTGWLGDRTDLTSLAVGELLTAMITVSDNTATNVLIDAVGMTTIGKCIDRHGLTGTLLRRHMMDAEARRRGDENITTAVDMTTLLSRLVSGADGLSDGSRSTALQSLLGQRTTGRLDATLPAGYRLAHKTGELPGVRHATGIVLDGDDRPVLALAVLCDGVEDEAVADAAIADRAGRLYERFGVRGEHPGR